MSTYTELVQEAQARTQFVDDDPYGRLDLRTAFYQKYGHGLFEEGYCLLYTSPSPRDKRQSRMPSSA